MQETSCSETDDEDDRNSMAYRNHTLTGDDDKYVEAQVTEEEQNHVIKWHLVTDLQDSHM